MAKGKGLTKGGKVAIGIGIVLLIGGVLYFLLRCAMKRLMCDVLIREGVGSQSGFLVLDMLLGSHLWE